MSQPSTPEWRQLLISFQAREIEQARPRMEQAVGRAKMKPETRDWVLKNMQGVLSALRRLDELELAIAAQKADQHG